MQKTLLGKGTALFLAVAILFVPVLSQQDPCLEAAIDAKRDINKPLWFGAGCLGGIVGWGAAYVVEPSPSAMRLMGKDPEYVALYTECYKMEGKKIQQKQALYGCLTFAGAYLLLNLLVGGVFLSPPT